MEKIQCIKNYKTKEDSNVCGTALKKEFFV